MRTHVEFRSTKFPAYEGEEEETNPGLWGKRLAEYLVECLHKTGIQTGEIYPEDWGWAFSVANDAFPMCIGCGHYEMYPDSYLVFIEPNKPTIRRFLKLINTTWDIERVADILDRILTTDPDIEDIRWWQNDEV